MKTESVKATKINFAAYSVKNDGEIDQDATIAKFTTELSTYMDLQAKDQPALANALEEIYSQAGNCRLPKKAVVTTMLAKVGFTATTFAALEERAIAVIDNNPRYFSTLGAGGGLSKMNDEQFAHYEETGLNPSQVEAAAKKAAKDKKGSKASS